MHAMENNQVAVHNAKIKFAANSLSQLGVILIFGGMVTPVVDMLSSNHFAASMLFLYSTLMFLAGVGLVGLALYTLGRLEVDE